jgi:hypothetical protein
MVEVRANEKLYAALAETVMDIAEELVERLAGADRDDSLELIEALAAPIAPLLRAMRALRVSPG